MVWVLMLDVDLEIRTWLGRTALQIVGARL